jgi:hypothetical protein
MKNPTTTNAHSSGPFQSSICTPLSERAQNESGERGPRPYSMYSGPPSLREGTVVRTALPSGSRRPGSPARAGRVFVMTRASVSWAKGDGSPPANRARAIGHGPQDRRDDASARARVGEGNWAGIKRKMGD